MQNNTTTKLMETNKMNKEEQKKLITEIMNEDAKDGLYKPAKTAVEWLIEQLKEYDCADIKDSQNWVIKIDALVLTAKVEQAKAMEKEQMEDCWIAAHQAGRFEGKGIAQEDWQTFFNYYNETYKNK